MRFIIHIVIIIQMRKMTHGDNDYVIDEDDCIVEDVVVEMRKFPQKNAEATKNTPTTTMLLMKMIVLFNEYVCRFIMVLMKYFLMVYNDCNGFVHNMFLMNLVQVYLTKKCQIVCI